MRVALLQINPTAGDIPGNSAMIVRAARQAREMGADLAVTPELALMGYLPRDLLMSHGFVTRSCQELTRMAGELAGGPPLLVGVATVNPAEMGRPLFNSAFLLKERKDLAFRFFTVQAGRRRQRGTRLPAGF